MVSQIYALASQHREGICWCTKICTSMRIQVNTMPKNAMEDKIHNACSWIMYVHACLTCKNSHAFAFPSLSVQEMQFRMSMELRCKDFRTMKETKKRTGVTAMVWEPGSPSSSAAEIRRTIPAHIPTLVISRHDTGWQRTLCKGGQILLEMSHL